MEMGYIFIMFVRRLVRCISCSRNTRSL